jgi:type 1 glutamine amidotransferase
MRVSPAVVVAMALLGCASEEAPGKRKDFSTGASVLVFSRTTGYRHASIEDGTKALSRLALERGWHLESTEDPTKFTDAGLSRFDVVVFLSTTGDVLDPSQERAFERFIQTGKGYVGVHAASDTEYDWPWYGGLVGAYFRAHPAVQAADVYVESGHPTTQGLPAPWTRTDEWYAFDENPRGKVEVLLTVDESSYDPGQGTMGDDHPIAWLHEYDGGRAFYTALGHTRESYAEPAFVEHLAAAIEWAAGK